MRPTFTLKQLWVAVFSIVFTTTVLSQPSFINKIPIPPLLDAAVDTIRLEMKLLTNHRFNPEDMSMTSLNDSLNGTASQAGIETWAYNSEGDTTMTFLGPTLKWHTGQMTNIKVTNLLPQPTTTHWHGAEVPAHLDGGPHQPISMGDTWHVNFVNLDSASTMWYHPHFHNNTYPQVQLGLSGMVISEQASDPIGPTLPRTYGIDDIPVIIGDQNFKYIQDLDIYRIDTNKVRRRYNLVNGVTNPYVEVPAHLVRLRILNGSTRKGLQFAVSDSYNSEGLGAMEYFTLIATDGGYTIKPDTMKTLLTGPGARAEILLDLTGKNPGEVLYLRNLKELVPHYVVGSPYTNPQAPNPNGGQDTTIGRAFLQLRVIADPPDYTPVNSFTSFTSPWDPAIQDTLGITRRRTKELVKVSGGPGFTIDGTTYDMMTINDTICEGAKEIWTIHNKSAVAHPFHIHKIFFRILDIDSMGTFIDLESRGLNGPKDDVLVRPNWKLRFLAKFDDYPNAIVPTLAYMYHCHILTHEDAEGGGMMHQFVVTDEGACAPLGVSEEVTLNDMVLFPNPAGNELYMKAHSTQASSIRVIDLQGRLLKEIDLPPFNNIVPIGINGLPPGFYIVSWYTAAGVIARKVLLH